MTELGVVRFPPGPTQEVAVTIPPGGVVLLQDVVHMTRPRTALLSNGCRRDSECRAAAHVGEFVLQVEVMRGGATIAAATCDPMRQGQGIELSNVGDSFSEDGPILGCAFAGLAPGPATMRLTLLPRSVCRFRLDQLEVWILHDEP